MAATGLFFVRAQSLGAAHELASGSSHNLNNILIGILAPVTMVPGWMWRHNVAVDSQLGAGTSFRLRIPVWDGPPPVETTTVEAVPDEHEGRRILIAEDEGIVAMVLEDCVRRLGFSDVIDRGDLALQKSFDGREAEAMIARAIDLQQGKK